MSGVKNISKRAAHKAAVALRKKRPIVKVVSQRKRKNPARLSVDFFTMAREMEREGIIMTRVERKPPRFYLETYDINGKRMNGALSARPKGQPRGWTLMLEHGGFHEFKFKRSALAFFARLVKLEVEVEETPVEDPALDRADEAIVSPAEYAELEAAADKCETGNKGCIEHGRDCENV